MIPLSTWATDPTLWGTTGLAALETMRAGRILSIPIGTMELKTAAGIAWHGLQWANRQIDWWEVAAIVGRGLVILAVLAYHAGYGLGCAVHRVSGALAALWRRLWVPQDVAGVPAEKGALQRPVVATPAVHPLAVLAEGLSELSCRELRRLSGVRAKRSKAWLVGAVCAV